MPGIDLSASEWDGRGNNNHRNKCVACHIVSLCLLFCALRFSYSTKTKESASSVRTKRAAMQPSIELCARGQTKTMLPIRSCRREQYGNNCDSNVFRHLEDWAENDLGEWVVKLELKLLILNGGQGRD